MRGRLIVVHTVIWEAYVVSSDDEKEKRSVPSWRPVAHKVKINLENLVWERFISVSDVFGAYDSKRFQSNYTYM